MESEVSLKEIERRKQYYQKNKAKFRAMHHARYMRNQETEKLKSRERHLRKSYGISLEDKKRMLVEEDHKCALCFAPIDTTNGHIDHIHGTKIIRGLLCSKCNLGIGCFKDNPILLEIAAAYVRNGGGGVAIIPDSNSSSET